MEIAQARELSGNCSDPYIKEVYERIAEGTQVETISTSIAGDNVTTTSVQLSAKDVDDISAIAFDHVKSNYTSHGIQYDSLEEARNKTQIKIAGDMLYNAHTGIGTMLDPNTYTSPAIPIMMGPYEGSAVYAPGGLPAQIIDKKSRAMVMQGATFKSYDDFWDADKVNALEEAAMMSGFNDAVNDASADAFIYGGSIMYPVFTTDTHSSFLRNLDDLHLQKNCISRWVTTDRWNTVIEPSFIVTARDYLKPDKLFIPQSTLDISTTRVALIKPKPVPYWVALYNLGWAPSDMSGWIRSYYGYEITCQSIPVMAQQMSLILYKMPLDSLNAAVGPDQVKKLMAINEENMSQWSSLSPKAVNMVGDVEVVDRTYSGFEQFIGAMKSNLAAQCDLPEPTLWHTPNKGFSDNTTESLLKQSETLQMSQKYLERNMSNCTKALIAHAFGTDSTEWEHRDTLKMTFNKPIISTEKDLAEVGARFSASVSSMTQAGVSPDIAMQLCAQFFPTIKLDKKLVAEAKKSYEKQLATQNKPLGRPQGNNLASAGAGKTTGSFTKAK